MKRLDFNKGFINESNSEVINEFLGTILVCGVLAAYGSIGVLNVFKKISGLRADLLELRQKRMNFKKEHMNAKYELELAKRKYLLAKTGYSKEDIDDIMSDNDDPKVRKAQQADEKELRDLLKKKKEDLSPKDQKRLEELAGKLGADSFSETDKEKYKALTGKTVSGDQDTQSTDLTTEEKAELDKQADEIQAQNNKALKRMMAYENAIEKLDEGEEKTKHTDNLNLMLKVMDGTGTPEDIEKLEKTSKESLSPEGQKLVDQVEKSADEISDEDLEKWKKEKGITDAGVAKTMATIAKEKPALLGEPEKETTQGTQGTQGSTQGAQGVQGGVQGTQGTQGTQDDEEDDPQKDDERTDNDDDLEDEKFDTKGGKATLSDKQDPRKVFKQRTYKRGNKTFRTKSYYSKRGVAISKDEFKERVANWEKKNKKDKVENSSFKGSPWTMTCLYETRKPAPVMEAEQGTDMESICKERLIYIKYVMDTTTNNVEKVKMERMYNTIYNCCFDANGKARSMDDLYTYLNDTMIANKGEIPGLPTNDQVTNIDDKCKAWRKLSPDKFDAYMAHLNKELLDKTGTKKTDKAKDLLSPDNEGSDTEIMTKIRDLSTKYGFTNILGLEPTRKASKDDDEKKDEINKQKKDGSPNADAADSKDVKADDVSPEQVDKIIGVSK